MCNTCVTVTKGDTANCDLTFKNRLVVLAVCLGTGWTLCLLWAQQESSVKHGIQYYYQTPNVLSMVLVLSELVNLGIEVKIKLLNVY